MVGFSLSEGGFIGSALTLEGVDLSVDRFDVFGELDESGVDFSDACGVFLVGG